MVEQSCGTCRYYEPETGDHGWCNWTSERNVPFHLENGYWEVFVTDGQSCPCWLPQEQKDAA